jgi:aryl-alcohol dehydrogenase-like predicted oxidoreductase
LASGVNPANGTSITVSAPLGNGVLGGGYGKRGASASTDTRFGDDVKQTFVSYRYNLSKRTFLAATLNKIDRDVSTNAATNDVKETHIFVGHTF